jgi:hypothetical protein
MENGWFNNMERLRNLEREIRVSLEKNPNTGKVLELFGLTVEFLMSPQDAQSDFCVLKCTIPPGISSLFHFTVTPVRRIFLLSLAK